jgi:hypothetical protein
MEVLGSWSKLKIGGEKQITILVFKHSSMETGRNGSRNIEDRDQFVNHTTDWDESLPCSQKVQCWEWFHVAIGTSSRREECHQVQWWAQCKTWHWLGWRQVCGNNALTLFFSCLIRLITNLEHFVIFFIKGESKYSGAKHVGPFIGLKSGRLSDEAAKPIIKTLNWGMMAPVEGLMTIEIVVACSGERPTLMERMEWGCQWGIFLPSAMFFI